jgi:hypothetical protein
MILLTAPNFRHPNAVRLTRRQVDHVQPVGGKGFNLAE